MKDSCINAMPSEFVFLMTALVIFAVVSLTIVFRSVSSAEKAPLGYRIILAMVLIPFGLAFTLAILPMMLDIVTMLLNYMQRYYWPLVLFFKMAFTLILLGFMFYALVYTLMSKPKTSDGVAAHDRS